MVVYDGEWLPNHLGGRENLGAIEFLRHLNSRIYEEFPDAITLADLLPGIELGSLGTTGAGDVTLVIDPDGLHIAADIKAAAIEIDQAREAADEALAVRRETDHFVPCSTAL